LLVQAAVMLTYVLALNWQREADRIRAKLAMPAAAGDSLRASDAAPGSQNGGGGGECAVGDIEGGGGGAVAADHRNAAKRLRAESGATLLEPSVDRLGSSISGQGMPAGGCNGAQRERDAGSAEQCAVSDNSDFLARANATPAALPDQPLAVAAGPGAFAPGHDAAARQALL